MRGTIIDTGNVNPGIVFDFVNSAKVDNSVIENLRQERLGFINEVGGYNTGFAEELAKNHELLLSNDSTRVANEIIARTEGLASDDRIHYVSVEDPTNLTSKMKEYVMSDPKLYKLYQNNRISGYDDVWYDNEPDVDPRWRDNYLKAIDGMLQDDGTVVQVITDGEDLSFTEKSCIKDAWEDAADLIASAIDPTSIYGEGM